MMKWHVFTMALLSSASNAFGGFNVIDERNHMISKPIKQQTRELVNACQGPNGTNYFEVMIRVVPDNVTESCSIADQSFLGNDLNQLLASYGLDDSSVSSDSKEFELFVAGLCPLPSISVHRNLQIRKNAFTWLGNGGCRFCLVDNVDKRSLRGEALDSQKRNLQDFRPQDPNWFRDVYAPEKEATIQADIIKLIVPNHAECIGHSPAIEFTLTEIALADLDFLCDDGTVIESLRSINLDDVPLLQHDCGECKSVDFSQSGNKTNLKKGDYVQDEWKLEDGLKIFASGGYTPGLKARILDTSDTECMSVNGTRDFGSPNVDCGVGGIGEGSGGINGTAGENCRPVGNVLIIQDSDKDCPDASSRGGSIKFMWDKPVMVADIGLMDIDEKYQRLRFTYADGFIETFTYQGFGDNAVQRVVANKMDVVELKVVFTGTGAVTQINFCHACNLSDGSLEHDIDHHCLYDNDGTLLKPELVIAYDDFEEASSFIGWSNARRDDLEQVSFTKFLGRYANGMEAPSKTFDVPHNAESVTIKIDFYEIDGWEEYQDTASILINDQIIELGYFGSSTDEGHREGITELGLDWTLDSITTPSYLGYLALEKDQKHRIKIRVPKETGVYADGQLTLTLKTFNSAKVDDESGGWDNIQLIATFGCEHQENAVASVVSLIQMCVNEEYSEDFEGDSPLSGWSNGKLESEGLVGFTKFLGRYGNGDASPEKVFTVPNTAEEIVVEVDFYEIDSWDGVSDSAVVYIDDEKVDLGLFAQWEDEGQRSGETSAGLLWQLTSITRPVHLGFLSSSVDLDQKHRVVITVPKTSGLFDDGKLVVRFEVILSRSLMSVSGGWDNVKISSKSGCKENSSTSMMNRFDPGAAPINLTPNDETHLTIPATWPTASTPMPTNVPTLAPTTAPTTAPTAAATIRAIINAITKPTTAPTLAPTRLPTHAPTLAPTIAPTIAPTLPSCTATPWTKLLSEDFEGINALSGWSNGKLETKGGLQFTKFLGRYSKNDLSPQKTFIVPSTATLLLFEIDFYEIDSWNGGTDTAAIYIGNQKIALGSFSSTVDEGARSGTTTSGLTWNLKSITKTGYFGFSPFDRDQKHHVSIEIPTISQLYKDGQLRVKLEVNLSSKYEFLAQIDDESGGWDNLKISLKDKCLA